jgi:hypothetical protein
MSTEGPWSIAHQIDHRVPQADLVGGVAARNDDRVHVGGSHGARGNVGRDLLPVAAPVDLALDRPHNLHGGAGDGERRARGIEIHVVVVVFHQNHHASAAERSRISHPGQASTASVPQRLGARHMIDG